MEELRSAKVFVRHVLAGKLSETDEGYVFQYDQEYLLRNDACVVSLTLPLNEKPYHSNVLFPFFDGLVPEGWLLNVASRKLKIDLTDRFGLLLFCCKDAIGNVTIEVDQR